MLSSNSRLLFFVFSCFSVGEISANCSCQISRCLCGYNDFLFIMVHETNILFWYTKWCLRIDSIQGFFEVGANFANIYRIANQKIFLLLWQTFNWQKISICKCVFFCHLIWIFLLFWQFLSLSFGKNKNCQKKNKWKIVFQIRWKNFFKFLNGYIFLPLEEIPSTMVYTYLLFHSWSNIGYLVCVVKAVLHQTMTFSMVQLKRHWWFDNNALKFVCGGGLDLLFFLWYDKCAE